MKALRLESWQSEPVLRDVPVPVPGSDEVLQLVAGADEEHRS